MGRDGGDERERWVVGCNEKEDGLRKIEMMVDEIWVWKMVMRGLGVLREVMKSA